MPPKPKFTKDTITEAALNVVRAKGLEALTARTLASELGSSARPVFTVFASMEDVKRQVDEKAFSCYRHYLQKETDQGRYPPYKAAGMGYIRFAKEEKELFRMLFMGQSHRADAEKDRQVIEPLLKLIQKNMGLNAEQAYRFHLEMWIFVHGIASMLATSYLDPDEEFVSEVLTDAFEGLKARWCGIKNSEICSDMDLSRKGEV